MPIFEFECAACGWRAERIQKASDPNPRCANETCGAETERVISRSNWQWGEGRKGSKVGEAIKRVKKAGF